MTFIVWVETPRFLRKPKEEVFRGDWKSEEEARRIVTKYRPKSKITQVVEHTW